MAKRASPNGKPPAQAVHHEARSTANSAAFVLPAIQRLIQDNPKLKILDVGSGSGSITAGFARLAPNGYVIGIDSNPNILPRARAIAEELGNIEFQHGDGHQLPFPDASFDVTFCHQVLVWTPWPWQVLGEMLRVTKPGGVVAAREGDFETDLVWPKLPILQDEYHKMVGSAMQASGGSRTAGRELLSWALKAGAPRSAITLSFSTWAYTEPSERETWCKGAYFFDLIAR